MADTIVIAPEPLTGFDLWTPNDYSNFITICAAAIGSTLLVVFKSRCEKISLCCGLFSCDRDVADAEDDAPDASVPAGQAAQEPPAPDIERDPTASLPPVAQAP